MKGTGEPKYYCNNEDCDEFWEMNGFCKECAKIIQLFQNIMPNASYEKTPDIKDGFNRIKMAAWKLEVFQQYGLF